MKRARTTRGRTETVARTQQGDTKRKLPVKQPKHQAKPKPTTTCATQHLSPAASLPRDILACILAFLTVPERFDTISTICKQFHNACTHRMLWERFATGCWGNYVTGIRGRALLGAVKWWEKYDCVPRALDLGAGLFAQADFRVLSLLSSITELTLRYPRGHHIGGLLALLPSLKQLQSLCIAYMEGAVSGDSIDFPAMPSLSTLCLSVYGPQFGITGLANMPNLTSLTINSRVLIDADIPPSVTHLKLESWESTPDVFSRVAQLPQLERLEAQCPRVLFVRLSTSSFASLRSLLVTSVQEEIASIASITTLRTLHIRDCTQFTASTISPLFRLSGLTDLFFHSSRTLSDADMTDIKLLTNLEHLKLQSFSHISVCVDFFASPLQSWEAREFLTAGHVVFPGALSVLALCLFEWHLIQPNLICIGLLSTMKTCQTVLWCAA